MKPHEELVLNLLVKISLIYTLLLIYRVGELKAQTTDTSFTFTEQQVIKLDSIIQSQEQVIKIQREKITTARITAI